MLSYFLTFTMNMCLTHINYRYRTCREEASNNWRLSCIKGFVEGKTTANLEQILKNVWQRHPKEREEGEKEYKEEEQPEQESEEEGGEEMKLIKNGCSCKNICMYCFVSRSSPHMCEYASALSYQQLKVVCSYQILVLEC